MGAPLALSLWALHAAAAASVGGLEGPAISILPGGAVQIGAPGAGGAFVLRSIFSHQARSGSNGPDAHTLGRNASGWAVTVDSSRAASGVWSVRAVGGGAAFSLHRIVSLNGTRIRFNDTITAASAHHSLQKLPAGLLLGLHVQHILEFPNGSTPTGALVPGARWRGFGGGACDNTHNIDEFGVHTGSYGNPTVFASTGTAAVGLAPLDDGKPALRWPFTSVS